jgi:hypothetical protein
MPSNKAAGESKPEAYPLGYVEDFDEPRTKLGGFFSILIVLLLCAAEQGYHPVHATHLDAHRSTCRTLPHRSQYHPADTGCDGDLPNRVDAVSPRISYRPRGPRVDGMELDRHGLRHVWNGGIGPRPCHGHKRLRRKRRNRRPAPL